MTTERVNMDNAAVTLPDAPAIPGLTFRHFRGESDYPEILEMNTASKVADGLDHDIMTLEVLTQVYKNTVNHDPYKDVLIAEVDGKMVGFNRVFWAEEPDGTRVYSHVGFVPAEWRGKGLGRTMIHYAEQRAREMEAAREGKKGGMLDAWLNSDQSGLEALLTSEGYKAVRYGYYMERDLENIPEIPMPEGLEVRPAEPEHYRAIYDAATEAFRDHWGFTEPAEGEYEAWLQHPLYQPHLWQVAWDGDLVAGMVQNYIKEDNNKLRGRKLGYTENISVRRPWRRRGLASALIARSMKMHKELGMTEVGLGVDSENPNGALQLYEGLGYKVVMREMVYRKEL